MLCLFLSPPVYNLDKVPFLKSKRKEEKETRIEYENRLHWIPSTKVSA